MLLPWMCTTTLDKTHEVPQRTCYVAYIVDREQALELIASIDDVNTKHVQWYKVITSDLDWC